MPGGIEIIFDQPVLENSVTKDAIRIEGGKLTGECDKAYIVPDYGDGKVVRFYSAKGFVSAQNETVMVKVSGIANMAGTVVNSHWQEIRFRDSTSPSVEKIIPIGNSRLDIYFSEPVGFNRTEIENLSNYQINEKAISVNDPELNADEDTDTARIISIKNISTILLPGEYILGVFGGNGNVVDTAGNCMSYERINFTIVDDREGPVVQRILEPVYPNEIRIEFDEEITEDATITWMVNSRMYTSEKVEIDGNIATFRFINIDDVLPFKATTITLKGAKDYSGNLMEGPLTFDVTAEQDSTKPVIVDYGSKKEGEIFVKFSKKIIESGAWRIKDSDGNTVYDYTCYVDPNDDNTIIVVGESIERVGTYTITVNGVKDRAMPTANELIEVTFDVIVPDTTAPEVASAFYSSATIINIHYNEKVDYGSAVARSNYQYSTDGIAYTTLPNTARVEMLPGERLIRITFKEEVKDPITYDGILYIKVTDVEDFAGNKMSSSIQTVHAAGAGNSIISAMATTRIKIELELAEPLTFFDVTDFTFVDANKDGKIINGLIIDTADLSVDGRKLTLILNKELSSNGQYNKKDLFLKIVGNDLAKNTPVTAITDAIKPEIQAIYYYNDDNYEQTRENSIVMIFNEKVAASDPDWAKVLNGNSLVIDKKLISNGDGYSWTVVGDAGIADDGTYAVYITFTSGTISYKDVVVNYIPTPGLAFRDTAGNDAPSIDFDMVGTGGNIVIVKYPRV